MVYQASSLAKFSKEAALSGGRLQIHPTLLVRIDSCLIRTCVPKRSFGDYPQPSRSSAGYVYGHSQQTYVLRHRTDCLQHVMRNGSGVSPTVQSVSLSTKEAHPLKGDIKPGTFPLRRALRSLSRTTGKHVSSGGDPESSITFAQPASDGGNLSPGFNLAA